MKDVWQWHQLYDVLLKDIEHYQPPVSAASMLRSACPF